MKQVTTGVSVSEPDLCPELQVRINEGKATFLDCNFISKTNIYEDTKQAGNTVLKMFLPSGLRQGESSGIPFTLETDPQFGGIYENMKKLILQQGRETTQGN